MDKKDKDIKYDRYKPCTHKGCLSHISHPCEGCGRIGGDGIIYHNEFEEMKDRIKE